MSFTSGGPSPEKGSPPTFDNQCINLRAQFVSGREDFYGRRTLRKPPTNHMGSLLD